MLTCFAMTSEPFRITITLKSFVARPMLTAGFFKTGWTIQTSPTDVTSTIIRCLTFSIVTAISTNRFRTWMQWILIFVRFIPTRLTDDITTAIAEITTSSLKLRNKWWPFYLTFKKKLTKNLHQCCLYFSQNSNSLTWIKFINIWLKNT